MMVHSTMFQLLSGGDQRYINNDVRSSLTTTMHTFLLNLLRPDQVRLIRSMTNDDGMASSKLERN